jgi:hypothetical protein
VTFSVTAANTFLCLTHLCGSDKHNRDPFMGEGVKLEKSQLY